MSCAGQVKSYNDTHGWGFIVYEGTDVFFHIKDCQDGNRPQPGDTVTFDVQDDGVRQGQMRAMHVTGGTGGANGAKGKGKLTGGMQMEAGWFSGGFGGGRGAGVASAANARLPVLGAAPPMEAGWFSGGFGGGSDGSEMLGPAGFAGGSDGCFGGSSAGTGKYAGTVKSFNDKKGWGFITYQGEDIFLHVKECNANRPQEGDWVKFDLEDDSVRTGAKRAINVTGGTAQLGNKKGTGFGKGGADFYAAVYGCKGSGGGYGSKGSGGDYGVGYSPYGGSSAKSSCGWGGMQGMKGMKGGW